jgi:hypothetical protein
MATPADADHYAELLFQLQFDTNPGTTGVVFVAMCRGSQRFDNGADQWQRPDVNTGKALRFGSATNKHDPEVHGTGTGIVNPAFIPSTGDSRAHWFIGDKTVDYDFLFWTHRRGFSGEVFADFGRFRTIGAERRSDDSEDPDPYIWFTGFESGTGSTNHNWFNQDHLRPREAATPLEDLETSSGTTAQTIMSYGIDDPAWPVAQQGHYGGQILVPAELDGFGSGIFYADANLESQLTQNVIVDTVVKVAHGNPAQQPYFIKGVLKNKLLAFNSKAGSGVPQVQAPSDPAESFRVAWGYFHVHWGAEERVENV